VHVITWVAYRPRLTRFCSSSAPSDEFTLPLYFDDPISWRYFLPAYLIWTLGHLETSDLFLVDETIYTFSVYEVGHPLRQHQVLRFDTLSSAQKTCVAHFLQYMAKQESLCDAEKAKAALADYWEQFS
jgi:hypothetical protein